MSTSSTEIDEFINHEDTPDECRKDMNRALREVYERVEKLSQAYRDLAHGVHRKLIRNRYELGKVLQAIAEDEAKNVSRTYGEHAMKKLATASGVSIRELYECQRLAAGFTEDELKELLSLQGKSGATLQWTHFREVMHLRSKSDRQTWLKRAIENEWTTEELGTKLRQEPSDSKDARGRPLAKPKNLDAAIGQQRKYAQDWTRRYTEVWSKPESSLSRLSVDVPTAKRAQMLPELRSLKKELEELVEVLPKQLQAVNKAISGLEKQVDDPSVAESAAQESDAATTEGRPKRPKGDSKGGARVAI
jgi:hypothetical protein